MGPCGAAAGVDVDRPRVAALVVVAPGTHHRRVAVQRHAAAEVVVGPGHAGLQFLLLGPGRARAGEDVSRSLVGRLEVGPRQDGAAVHVHGDAEVVAGRRVGRREHGSLGPGAARSGEDVDRPAVGQGGDVPLGGAHGHDAAADAHREAEPVVDRAHRGLQLGRLAPGAAAAGEDVGRAGLGAVVVVPGRAHHRRVAVDGHGDAEPVAASGVAGHHLLLGGEQGIDGHGVGRAAVVDVDRQQLAGGGQRGRQGPAPGVMDVQLLHEQLRAPAGDQGNGAQPLARHRTQVAVHLHLQHQGRSLWPRGRRGAEGEALLQAQGAVEVPFGEGPSPQLHAVARDPPPCGDRRLLALAVAVAQQAHVHAPPPGGRAEPHAAPGKMRLEALGPVHRPGHAPRHGQAVGRRRVALHRGDGRRTQRRRVPLGGRQRGAALGRRRGTGVPAGPQSQHQRQPHRGSEQEPGVGSQR